MNSEVGLSIHNCQSFDVAAIPVVSIDTFHTQVAGGISAGGRLVCLFGWQPDDRRHLVAVIHPAHTGHLVVMTAPVGDRYPALTSSCPQAHLFEREIAEQWGIVAQNHPWLKPVRFQHSYRPGPDAWGRSDGQPIAPAVTDFFAVAGEEVHEVAVGPVHAGIIEPGHFRFQCHGEKVLHLEIALGFQHRGIERALVGGPDRRTRFYMQTIAGDTTIGHTSAYAQVIEALSGTRVPARAMSMRAIALELERLANHIGDLGAIAGDVGYLPTASFCGRIRGDFLNTTAMICGNRFGRGWVRTGGVGFDFDDSLAAVITERISTGLAEVRDAVDLLWTNPSVLARLEDTGVLTKDTALALGMVGPAARACGIARDVRFEFPHGIYTLAQLPLATCDTGDAYARAYIRWLEIQRSADFILDQLAAPPRGELRRSPTALDAGKMVVSLVEGWRGEICHVAVTDTRGRFARYKVVDPSFHNWMGLAIALREEQIADFPLCNKSFNLSYCGHDL